MQTLSVKKMPKITDGPHNAALSANVAASIGEAKLLTTPFRHWLFQDIISSVACEKVRRLPLISAKFGDTYGKRDSHNDIRKFFAPVMQEEFPVMREIAEAFQSNTVVRSFEKLCGITLSGSYLRIEYCQDCD